MRRNILVGMILMSLAGNAWAEIQFTDVTRTAGIRFVHNNGAYGAKYLPETMGAGGAFLDYNNDGWLDIFLVNGMNWPNRPRENTPPSLYRNNQDGTFTDVAREAGLAVPIYGMGVAAADNDNDGDADLYITALGPDRLFQNDGNGRYRDVTRQAGLGNSGFGTSAAFLDFDRDGHLDLFVANYVEWSIDTDIYCSLDGESKSYCTPEPYPATSPRLYRNLGNGKFEDARRSGSLSETSNKGLGVLVFDYNRDHWPDILLANDTQPNKLWENRGDGSFEEVGVLAGIAFSEEGLARGAMGIDGGDYDRSGYPSIIIGNFSNEMLSLYHNERNGLFIDDAPTSEVGRRSLLSLTFGCFFFDYDLDGFLDIYAANGHVENEIHRVQKMVRYPQPPHLFKNLDGNQFQEVTSQMGVDFAEPRVARGAAYGDYDNDGDLDILLTTCGGPAKLFRNDGGNRNNWLTIDLRGTKSNRDGVGAQVKVWAANGIQTGAVKTGGSYCSQSQLRLTFGLGTADLVDRIEIYWPSGEQQELRRIKANQILRVQESETGNR